MTPNKEISLS